MISNKFFLTVFVIASAISFAPPAHADGLRNGLPPCRMDSFVRSAGASADLIYGDESGRVGKGELGGAPPPYFGYTADHRIESGIVGRTAAGLTTGHASYLPSASGGDQFTGDEWSIPNVSY